MNHFINQTNLKLPGRKSDQRFWWASIVELLRLTDNDLNRAMSLVDGTIVKMRSESLTIATPNSLINPARALLASTTGHGQNGSTSKVHPADQARLAELKAQGF